MDRRLWLKLLTALLAEQSIAWRGTAEAKEMTSLNQPQVIVIGSGLAGLAAAKQLQTQGLDVLVLEARDRIGGRLWTSQKWPGTPLDLGASWIHGVDDNPMTELADEVGAERISTSYDRNIIYDFTGRELSDSREADYRRLRSRVQKALHAAQDADQDKSIRDVITDVARQLQADNATQQLLDFIVNSEIEQEYGGSATRLSAHWYDHIESFDGEDALFVDGYRVIIDFLSKGLAIKTNEVVKQIDWSKSPVKVITSNQEFTAEKVLVTLPLGVLKAGHVEFKPELPESKTKAIDGLEMGILNKCFLKFAEIFWPDDVDWLEYIPKSPGEWTEWVSFARTTGKPVLLGFHAGDRGRAIEALSDRDTVASAMRTLRTIFGPHIPEPIDFQITRWASDPFALGAYSYNPVGIHPRARDELAKPLRDRLFFAGEATDPDHFATAHGAYLSGLRAAEEITP